MNVPAHIRDFTRRAGHGPRRGADVAHSERGVALILVLVFIVLLSVLVVEFSYETQVEASFALNQDSDFNLKLAARSAVAQGIALLAEDLAAAELSGLPQFDAIYLDAVDWALGYEFQPLGDAEMRTSISDEYGKINLNALFYLDGDIVTPNERLQAVLRQFLIVRAEVGQFEVDGDVVTDSILDWLDYGEDDEIHDDGAEEDFYQRAEIPYSCKNGPMDSIEELLLIRGMTPEFYYGDPDVDPPILPLTELLTVHGDWFGRINVNTAPLEVLLALSNDSPSAEDVWVQREEQAFQSVQDIPQDFAQECGVVQSNRRGRNNREDPEVVDPQQTGTSIDDVFTVSSAVFRIYGDAMQDDTVARVEAYVLRYNEADPSPLIGITESQQSRVSALDIQVPVEPFRILDWKFIQ